MEELTQAIYHYLTTATSSSFLGQDIAILTHWEGADNLLWRVACGGQEAVVKYYLDAGQARGRRQYDGQERFHARGLAPQPLWFDRYPTGLSRQLLVYRWAPGAELDGTNERQLVQMAQAVAQVHGGDPTDVRRFSPNPVNLDYLWKVLHGGLPSAQAWLQQCNAHEFANWLNATAANAQALVDAALPLWQGVAPTPVHGDLKLENTIESLGTVLLLDWELFGIGDAAYDVALFLAFSQSVLTTERREQWLESYLATFSQPGIVQRIGVYERILPFQQLLYLLHGLRQNTVEEADLLRANQSFLSATILATVQRSAAALQVATVIDEEEIAKLFSPST